MLLLSINSVFTVCAIGMCVRYIHRNEEDWKSNRVILNKEVISPKVLENFVPLLDEVGEDFVARVHKKIKRSGQNKWTTDLSQELFKYALECEYIYVEYISLTMHTSAFPPLCIACLCVMHSGELSTVWGAFGFDAGLH